MNFSLSKKYLALLIVLVLACGVLIWFFVLYNAPRNLSVSFLDVGQGDAILIQTPHGSKVLIDAGANAQVLRSLQKELNFFDRSIDVVIATHPDKDHIGGMPSVFERYEVRAFIENGMKHDTNQTAALRAAVSYENLTPIIAKRGMEIFLDEGVILSVLYPYQESLDSIETNDASIVLKLTHGENTFLFTGDLTSVYEAQLVALDGEKLDSDVLKAGHHGSKYSTDALFLSLVTPEYLIISAGKENEYGHPAPEVISRGNEAGARILSTISEGTITFISDGQTLHLK